VRSGIYETGFWHNAFHIDTCGFGAKSSLTTYEAAKCISKFQSTKNVLPLIRKSTVPCKYPQVNLSQKWTGVVLAAQKILDRSVYQVGSVSDYWRFFTAACKYYGSRLFIKMHPMCSMDGEVMGHRMFDIALVHKCQIGYCNLDILTNCEFVIAYNSTIAADCFIRGVRYVQYAPGYFYQLPAVTYTKGEMCSQPADTVFWGYKTADFLLWKYCIHRDLNKECMIKLFKIYANSRDMFPLPLEFSYAATTLDKNLLIQVK
jgi:hypothetical protein